jgi:ketosteroid isomerase-like protein
MKPGSLWVFVLLFGAVAFAQGPCTEHAVRNLAPHAKLSVWSNDVYFFTGALDKPVVGKAAYQASAKPIAAERKNEDDTPNVPQRIVAARSGDMAYEYGTAHVGFTDKQSGKREDFTAAYLRVWKAEGTSCKVAAFMAEPEGPK